MKEIVTGDVVAFNTRRCAMVGVVYDLKSRLRDGVLCDVALVRAIQRYGGAQADAAGWEVDFAECTRLVPVKVSKRAAPSKRKAA